MKLVMDALKSYEKSIGKMNINGNKFAIIAESESGDIAYFYGKMKKEIGYYVCECTWIKTNSEGILLSMKDDHRANLVYFDKINQHVDELLNDFILWTGWNH